MLAFFLTCISVFAVNLPRWTEPFEVGAALWASLQFTLLLMSILLAHEWGHVFVARRHRFRLGLPWFVPFPLWFGTMGAILVPRESPRDRDALAQMGAAGPLAGAVCVLAVWVGLFAWGEPQAPVAEDWRLARPLLWRVLAWLFGTGAAGPSMRDPVALAGWIGCLVTAMNLLPFGQLDGGHVFSAHFPRWARWGTGGVTGLLLVAGAFWPGWLVWVVLLYFVGSRRPIRARDEARPPGKTAKQMGWACLALFILCAMPVPFS